MLTDNELIAAQDALELEALDLGLKRYQELRTRGEAELPPGQRLIKSMVSKVATGIRQWLTECATGVPSRSLATYYFLQQWADGDGPEMMAYVTCRSVIDSITRRLPLQMVSTQIAVTLEDQINHDALRTQDARAYRKLMEKIKKSSDPSYRHIVLRKQQKYAGIKVTKWGREERVRVGSLLIEIMQQATGMYEIGRQYEGQHNTPLRIIPTAETLHWLDQSHARCELLSPTFMPMVTQPRPWSNPFNGGYRHPKMRKPLVKGANRNLLEELKHFDMPLVYRALNAMQDTAWSVNPTIFRILREVWDGGGNLGGLPAREELPLPAKNFTDEDATNNTEAFKAWKSRATETYEENIARASQCIQTQCKLWVAEKMSAFERFHFVHALDFRGRAYAVASFLNPQSDDSAKAMLQFADGKPLGEHGAFWLAVHGANTFGVDKVSFEERTAWVEQHTAQIIESADNPLDGARWWTQASNPWQFLAFCIEWRNLNLALNMGSSPELFLSRLPVGMDGACNGLQNFSAMLRDEIGGAATNLIPCDRPADVYAQVAVESQRIIDGLAAEGNQVAQRWAGKINRKLTKRNTMTVPYAVTEYGMRDQLVNEFKKLRHEGECDPVIKNATLEDAILIAHVNHEAIGKVVVAARAAMDWLKEVARVVASDGLPVQWVTPSGFLVVQDYREMIGDRMNLTIAGRRVRLTLESKGSAVNRRKQASGISPNFVHALDAAHLQRTVGLCLDHGITTFAMVHDSYGTHAADVQGMSVLLRQAFIEQYSGDVLGDFRNQMIAQIPEAIGLKIPPPLPMGTLDLNGIMDSDYFFA